jgi:hypothetical protein
MGNRQWAMQIYYVLSGLHVKYASSPTRQLTNSPTHQLASSPARQLQPGYPVNQPLPVLFVAGVGVFHLTEHGTGNFGTIAAIPELVFVDGTVVQWAHFGGHVLQRPEGLTFNGMAAVAFFFKKFTFGTDKSTG